METATDFGTGLRAHLGLEDAEQAELTVIAEPEVIPARIAADAAPGAVASDRAAPDALASLEAELLERERVLALRESTLAGRAGSVLAAAQALYDEVLGGGPPHNDDELARLRRRKSVA
ncbi:MAG: hypothetical protein M3R12_07270 [Actinomycetota bacterium]|nr:hypothetical protein [Actinomycetota bacterium]